MKYPKKYLKTNPNIMKREIKKHKDKADDDASAYGPWDADYKSRKTGKGKPVPTKTSKYTKKFKELYGESEESINKEAIMENLIKYDQFGLEIEKVAYDVFIECADLIDESGGSSIETALKNKAKKSGFPLGILRQVYNRGKAAWKNGHIPGTNPEQWGLARVNSFVTGGRTTKVGDGALYAQGKKAKSERKK
jgi:hypothetical protein